MAGHPPSLREDLDRGGAQAHLHPLADQLVGDAVAVAVDLDVVVDVDGGHLPGGELVGLRRQRPQRRSVDLLEEALRATRRAS